MVQNACLKCPFYSLTIVAHIVWTGLITDLDYMIRTCGYKMAAGTGDGTQLAFSIAPAFVREGLDSQNIAYESTSLAS